MLHSTHHLIWATILTISYQLINCYPMNEDNLKTFVDTNNNKPAEDDWKKTYLIKENCLLHLNNDQPSPAEVIPEYLYNLDDINNDNSKRSWNNLHSTGWGKRSREKWEDLKGIWGKREPTWTNLRGIWGKRNLLSQQ